MGRFYSFFLACLCQNTKGGGDDVLIWQFNHSGIFDVPSFYNSLLKAPSVSFPKQSIWCVKVPKRVFFIFYGLLLGVGFLQQITLLRRTCLLLIGVAYVGVMRKLWITFCSIISLLIVGVVLRKGQKMQDQPKSSLGFFRNVYLWRIKPKIPNV